jgi:hypothetical protein
VTDFADRCLRIIAMPREQIIQLAHSVSDDRYWFLKNIDALAPELHRRGWIEYRDFDHRPGSVVVTTGNGDIRMVVATSLGRAQLNVAMA